MKDWCWINRSAIKNHGAILGGDGLAILMVIASFENEQTKTAFPSQALIARLIGISVNTVKRKLKILDQLGYIQRTGTKGIKTIYKLTTPTGIVEVFKEEVVSPVPMGGITSAHVVVSPVPNNDTNTTNIINETVSVGTKPYFLAVNYFYKQYNTKYNTPYPVNRARYIKQMSITCPDLSFESLKKMVDKFLDGGGVDFQKFIWNIPELHASVIDFKAIKKHGVLSEQKSRDYYSQDAILRRMMNGEA